VSGSLDVLIVALHRRIQDAELENEKLRQDLARCENARLVWMLEIDTLRRRLGYDNTHPANIETSEKALALIREFPEVRALLLEPERAKREKLERALRGLAGCVSQ